MIEQMIASFGSGFLGIASGSTVTFLVLRERVNNLIDNSKENKETVNRRLAEHDTSIKAIINRNHCGPCDRLDVERQKGADDRHQQMKEWMDRMQHTLDSISEKVSRP